MKQDEGKGANESRVKRGLVGIRRRPRRKMKVGRHSILGGKWGGEGAIILLQEGGTCAQVGEGLTCRGRSFAPQSGLRKALLHKKGDNGEGGGTQIGRQQEKGNAAKGEASHTA